MNKRDKSLVFYSTFPSFPLWSSRILSRTMSLCVHIRNYVYNRVHELVAWEDSGHSCKSLTVCWSLRSIRLRKIPARESIGRPPAIGLHYPPYILLIILYTHIYIKKARYLSQFSLTHKWPASQASQPATPLTYEPWFSKIFQAIYTQVYIVV